MKNFMNSRDSEGRTPLHVAVESNCNKEQVEKLIKYGADVNALIECKDSKTIRELPKESSNFDGDLSLHVAIRKQNVEIVKLLLEHKANINVKNHLNCTPIFFACIWNSLEMVKLLLEHGANVNENFDIDIVLEQSKILRPEYDDVRKLISLIGGFTPLHWTCVSFDCKKASDSEEI